MIDIRDTLGMSRPVCFYSLELQAGSGGYPFTLQWNPADLPAGKLFMRDRLTHGELLRIDMHAESTAVIDNPSIDVVDIEHLMITTLLSSMANQW